MELIEFLSQAQQMGGEINATPSNGVVKPRSQPRRGVK